MPRDTGDEDPATDTTTLHIRACGPLSPEQLDVLGEVASTTLQRTLHLSVEGTFEARGLYTSSLEPLIRHLQSARFGVRAGGPPSAVAESESAGAVLGLYFPTGQVTAEQLWGLARVSRRLGGFTVRPVSARRLLVHQLARVRLPMLLEQLDHLGLTRRSVVYPGVEDADPWAA